MATVTVRNGVDVQALLETIEAIKGKPELAQFTFRASTRWQEGTHSTAEIGAFVHAGADDETRARPFRLEGDEPPVLLGRNLAPNAVELMLAALGFCYSVGYVANAAARGIELQEMEYEFEGDLDVRSFLGISTESRPGFSEIRARARVKAEGASEEELKELCTYVQETSPVKDVLVNPVPVKTTLEVVA
ncbi:MAG: OsmC family protein [Thermoleophilia bacterium]|nr:OsmC family protein [Thermoleophilia bacterium]